MAVQAGCSVCLSMVVSERSLRSLKETDGNEPKLARIYRKLYGRNRNTVRCAALPSYAFLLGPTPFLIYGRLVHP